LKISKLIFSFIEFLKFLAINFFFFFFPKSIQVLEEFVRLEDCRGLLLAEALGLTFSFFLFCFFQKKKTQTFEF